MTATTTTPAACDRGGSVWSYLSASRLNLWLRCPLAFRLKYVDGVRTPTSPALFLGKRVHDALELHYRHRQLGVPLAGQEVVGRIAESWDQAVEQDDVVFKDGQQEAALKQQAAALVQAYLEHVADGDPYPRLVETSLEVPLVDPVNGEDLGVVS